MKPYWTEPTPWEEAMDAERRAWQEAFQASVHHDTSEFDKKGWDKNEETHKRKEALFKKLNEKGLPTSEYAKIIKEINSL